MTISSMSRPKTIVAAAEQGTLVISVGPSRLAAAPNVLQKLVKPIDTSVQIASNLPGHGPFAMGVAILKMVSSTRYSTVIDHRCLLEF